MKDNITSYLQSLQTNNATAGFIKNETYRTDMEIKNFPDCCVLDPPQYYWYHNALQVSPLLEEAGGMNWKIVGCLAAGWFVVYVCVLKGVKSSGKVKTFWILSHKPSSYEI